MLCAPSNLGDHFRIIRKWRTSSIFVFCPFSRETDWYKLRRLYWTCQVAAECKYKPHWSYVFQIVILWSLPLGEIDSDKDEQFQLKGYSNTSISWSTWQGNATPKDTKYKYSTYPLKHCTVSDEVTFSWKLIQYRFCISSQLSSMESDIFRS